MDFVKKMYRKEKVSSKNGNPYQVLVIEFANGYVFETFLSNEQIFCLSDVPLE